MKSTILVSALFISAILFSACTKEITLKGDLVFKTLNPYASSTKSTLNLKSILANPPLTGDTTITVMTSLDFCIGDVWVSQGEVVAGNKDSLEWIRLTTTTNRELKLFEDYVFPAVEIPAGDYKSIKITFRNIFYRYVELLSDNTLAYELFETMGSYTDPCNTNDTTWVKPNYFSSAGNHSLNSDGIFELVSEGEKIGGFVIEEGKTAIVSWRLGAGVSQPCTTYLLDVNKNREWDCGTDLMEFECPPEAQYMWDFVVEYQ